MRLGENKATVFDPAISDKLKNTVVATISTLESGKDEAKEYSSWNVKFVGKAFEKAKTLKDRDFINITEAKINNHYVKEKQKLYVTVTIFGFTIIE